MSTTSRAQADAAALVIAALRQAKRAGAFDAVAAAMLLTIAGIVRKERGADVLDQLLAVADAENRPAKPMPRLRAIEGGAAR